MCSLPPCTHEVADGSKHPRWQPERQSGLWGPKTGPSWTTGGRAAGEAPPRGGLGPLPCGAGGKCGLRLQAAVCGDARGGLASRHLRAQPLAAFPSPGRRRPPRDSRVPGRVRAVPWPSLSQTRGRESRGWEVPAGKELARGKRRRKIDGVIGYGARSVRRSEAGDRERARRRHRDAAPASGPPAPLGPGSAPPLGPNGGVRRTRAARAWNPRRPANPGRRRLRPPAAAAGHQQNLYPGREPATAGRRRGGAGVPACEAPPRSLPPRPPPPRRPHSGRRDPHSRRGRLPAAGLGDVPKGGPPCGKRRHGRSCSVNESKRPGDRGLPGGRHAKGGGGGGRSGRGREERKKARAAATASQPGMCTNPGERDQRDWKQTGDWRGEGAGQPVESSLRSGGPGFHRDSSGLLGVLIIILKFLNRGRARDLRRLRLAGSRSEMMQSATVPAEGAVKGLPEMLGVPMQRKTPPFLADLILTRQLAASAAAGRAGRRSGAGRGWRPGAEAVTGQGHQPECV